MNQESQTWGLSFEGRYSDYVLHQREPSNERLLRAAEERRDEIEQRIQAELSEALRGEVTVRIEFREGSFEWFGDVNAVLGALANLGGTIALAQLVGTVISRVLARLLPLRGLPRPYTRVVVVYSPPPRPPQQPERIASERDTRLLMAVIIVSLALNAAAVSVLAWAVVHLVGK